MVVVFFPSSPFMGVMLFPSLWLGNASGRGGGGGGGGGGGRVHALRRTPCFPSVFLPLFYTSLLPFSFLLSFWLHCFLICFFFFLSPLSPSFFSSSPLSCLLFIMSFSFVPFFSFLRELLVLCALRELYAF